MLTTQPFEAIIFDHDGTLVDTESPDFQACRMLFEKFGVPLTLEKWAETVVGRMDGYEYLFQEIVRFTNNGVKLSDLWQQLRELWTITFEKVELMPGVMKLLPELHSAGYQLGVATASDRQWAIRWLTHFDLLPYFRVIACGDEVVHNKPAPDVYLLAAAHLGVQPERCLVFEDSVAGIQAAKSANMTVIAVPSHVTKTLDFSQADRIIDGLENVTAAWVEAFEQNGRNRLLK